MDFLAALEVLFHGSSQVGVPNQGADFIPIDRDPSQPPAHYLRTTSPSSIGLLGSDMQWRGSESCIRSADLPLVVRQAPLRIGLSSSSGNRHRCLLTLHQVSLVPVCPAAGVCPMIDTDCCSTSPRDWPLRAEGQSNMKSLTSGD